MNLVYFYLTSEFKDGAKIVETAIAEATADWTRTRQRTAARRARLVAVPPTRAGTGRKLPPPPAWWKGDEDAMRSTLVARQQLRGRKGG